MHVTNKNNLIIIFNLVLCVLSYTQKYKQNYKQNYKQRYNSNTII